MALGQVTTPGKKSILRLKHLYPPHILCLAENIGDSMQSWRLTYMPIAMHVMPQPDGMRVWLRHSRRRADIGGKHAIRTGHMLSVSCVPHDSQPSSKNCRLPQAMDILVDRRRQAIRKVVPQIGVSPTMVQSLRCITSAPSRHPFSAEQFQASHHTQCSCCFRATLL